MVDLAEFSNGLVEPHGILYSQLGLTRLFESRISRWEIVDVPEELRECLAGRDEPWVSDSN